MSRTKLFASLLLTTALAAPAFAADGPMQPTGWKTEIARRDGGAFAYCVSQSTFDGNFGMVLALTPSGDINLGIGQKGAQLPVGEEKQVRIVIDSQSPVTLSARAVKPELMVVNVGRNDAFLDAVAKASTLKVDNMTFAMRGSGHAIATLRDCVANMGGDARAAAPAQAPAAEAPAQVAATEAPAAPAAAAPVAPAPSNEIRWNGQVAMPGQRELNTLPPSMQREQAEQLSAAQLAAQQALSSAAPLTTTAPAVEAPAQAELASAPQQVAQADAPVSAPVAPAQIIPAPAVLVAPAAPAQEAGMAPALEVPAPAAAAPVAAQEAAPAPVAPAVLTAATPVEPVVKPLPAQLETLLKAARVRDIQPAAVTSSDIAYAWKSRDMNGNVRELGVPAGSSIEQLAGQYFSRAKSECGVNFTASLGKVDNAGPLQLLTGSTVCAGNGRNDYTTIVFALSRQGVLSIVSHEITRGRRAAPDRAQAGVVEALKNTQG